jgi:type VI secretion system protein ImpF
MPAITAARGACCRATGNACCGHKVTSMARPARSPRLQHSLWDRLTNPELIRGENVALSPGSEIERLKNEVCRDLEWLLNTRTAPLDIPDGLKELESSLVKFGLPDFSTLNFGDPKVKDRLATLLESVIRQFEPRLVKESVKVEFNDLDQDKSRSMMHYRIRAELRVKPIPQPVQFDTVLELVSKSFSVKGEGG